MKETLVSFETAKLAKEKGFDIEVKTYFNTKKFGNKPCEFYGLLNANDYNYWDDKLKKNTNAGYISAPTQSLLQKYLREKYSIFIEIRHCFKDLTKYTFHVYTTWEEYMEKLKKAFKNEMPICNTYEEALEEGLYEALKLI